ncbi:MAG: efflux RND transporter permease subunit, partial [Planctomycetota bacterium]
RFGGNGGQVELTMDPDDARWEKDDVGKLLTLLLPRFPGVIPRYGWGGGTGGAGGGFGQLRVNVMLSGQDTNQLTLIAEDVSRRLEALDVLSDVATEAEEGRDEMVLSFDRTLAAAANANLSTISRTLAFNLNGTNLPDLQPADGGPSRRVRMSFEAWTQFDPNRGKQVAIDDDLPSVMDSPVPIQGSSSGGAEGGNIGGVVRLQTLITRAPQFTRSLSRIQRQDRRTSLTVSASVKGGDIAAANKAVYEALASLPMPSGYQWELGDRERRRQILAFQDLPFALGTALFCVFALMAVFFESVYRPFAIICTVPLAFIGVIWTMKLTGMAGNPVVAVGMVILIGLVVNNGIVLVDLIIRNIAAGKDRREAIVDAGVHRFRPILMTSATTIVGLIPMAMGSGTFVGIPWFPIARTVIGGLLASTLLTLIVIPVVYSVIDDYLEGRAMSGGRPPTLWHKVVSNVVSLLFIVPVLAAGVGISGLLGWLPDFTAFGP